MALNDSVDQRPADAGELSPDKSPAKSHPFPIVGIGASAGGLEAFSDLLTHLPADPGLAILFVLHLEPHHKSHLVEIFTRVSAMSVQEATEGMPVQVNRVYLIPPNTNMALADGKLALSPRSAVRGTHMPIDYLFRSLAEVQRERAIGIILSGGGTDGTLGFQAIKAEGGITFAQDEKTARQDSMPRSATNDGHVDYVFPPDEIARQLVRLAGHPYTQRAEKVDDSSGLREDVLSPILVLLRANTQVDFSHYKPTTIKRRIQRRMALLGLEDPQTYLHRLRGDPVELSNLFQDLLIRVTQFFRDPGAFEALQKKVFPILVKGRQRGVPIRIWVAGCSTGEEVYSLAMCLLEFLDSQPESFPIKILATDLSEAALDKARAGLYIDNIEIDVSPERLRRFFVRINNHYQISKSVRDLCVFSRHNMATDPPFSHLDLVSCRNVLIYMDAALQHRVMPIFHYGLNPHGFLFLGGSENVGSFTALFETVDSGHRIFAKRAAGTLGPIPDFGSYLAGWEPSQHAPHREVPPLWSAMDVQKEADRTVLGRYAPVGVVIDETMTVLQFRGRTAPYLEPAPGTASLDLLRMLKEGLIAEVRSAVNQAKAENAPAIREAVRLPDRRHPRTVRVEVLPLKVPTAATRFFLVLFQDITQPAATAPSPVAVPDRQPSDFEKQVGQLQQELVAMREYLQSVIEEHESTNEELKSANEEILSANEELQSTNEELQTAKEEAQSANEELNTVNEELRYRNAELGRVNNDLVNLLGGVDIPIVMVSRDLRVRRFTPVAEKVFNLITTDVGRPISDIKPNLVIADLGQLIARVIDTLTPHESEVQDKAGHWYALHIRPYVTLDGKIDGASIVLLDIDAIKRNVDHPKPPANEPAPDGAESDGE